MRLPTTTTTTRLLAAFLSCLAFHLTSAQSLTFVRPDFASFNANGNGTPQLTAGDNITIAWESEFQYTTLLVYQEIDSTRFQVDVLAQGARSDKTEVQWQVGAVAGDDLSKPFHFELRNAVNPTCEGCALNSENFVVSRRQQESSSSAASGSSTTAASRTSTSTASPTQTVGSAQSTTDPNSAAGDKSSDESSDSLRLGLGIGLGIGIPLLLAAVGLLFCLRRRRRRRDSLPRGRQPSPAQSLERASGAWLYQDGRQSQQDMLFRPSTAARSEMSSWSHRSWIEPFEFEQTEMRDVDAMSQLRRSIHSSSGGRRSQLSMSNVVSDWDGAPEVPGLPQSVHDGKWSSPRQ